LGVFRVYGGAKILGGLSPNFLVVDVTDVITCFKFGDDRLRGLAPAKGQKRWSYPAFDDKFSRFT